MNKLTKRIISVIPAVLLQVLWYVILFKWLAPWAIYINTALSILAFFFVLYLITKQDEVSYKILWLLIILTFPLLGALLYLCFGNKRTARPLKKRLAAAKPIPAPYDDSKPLYEELEADSKRIAQTFQSIQSVTGMPMHRNRTAKYYPLGDDAFPDMLEAMEQAEHYIFMEYFIVASGLMWDTMVEVMERKAAQGVDVRFMYDDLGSISTFSRENMEQLQKKGIRCACFNPLVIIKGTLNNRDHRKMLIVDGKVAFSGGINLADEYINHIVRFGHWKDTCFRLTGEAVDNYVHMFAEFWNAFTKDPIPNELISGEPFKGQEDLQDGFVLSYYDSPPRDMAVSNELFIDLLSQAKDYAYFYTPYLLPSQALLDTFVRTARRGVDIRIITPGIPDKKLVFRMTRSFYPVLLEAGVKIYEYTPGFIHAKSSIIDDTLCTIGTVNLDYRSLFLHFENNSLFYQASMLADMKADFLATQEKCRERTLENLNMNFFKWLLNGVLRIFAPLC